MRLGTVPPSVTIPCSTLTHNSCDSTLTANRSSRNTHCSISLSVILGYLSLAKTQREFPAISVGHVELRFGLQPNGPRRGNQNSASQVIGSGLRSQRYPCSSAVEFLRAGSSNGLRQ